MFEKLRNEKKQLEDEITHLKNTKRIITKTTGCDFCILEHSNRKRKFKDIQDADYSISFLTEKLNVCKEHMKEFRDSIDKELKDE